MVERININETINGGETISTANGFYFFKNSRQEYFFVSDTQRKTKMVVDNILKYVFGVGRFERIRSDANTYRYYNNAIQPATLTIKESPRWGKYADIVGNGFNYGVMDSDDTVLDIVEELI